MNFLIQVGAKGILVVLAENKMILEGKRYRHFKGKEYKILAIAEHSETAEKLVVYKALYPPYQTWARPVKMFEEEVDRPDLGYRGPRFVKID